MLEQQPKERLLRGQKWRLEKAREAPTRLPHGISEPALRRAIESARNALVAAQHADGYWCFELEADCTIPAEYILMMHYMDEIDEELQTKIAVFLRERQRPHGGWTLYQDGDFDLSCTVKVYYALKLAGDSVDAPHMSRARAAIHARGGAARCNVFTRITLALFEQLPWRGVPFIPVEINLLPRWFPFHLTKVSYWSRTVMVPLTVLCSLKARATNPRRVHIEELFTVPPHEETNYFPIRSRLNHIFLWLDRMGRRLEPLIPPPIRRWAVRRAERWCIERLNGTDGLGAIFPAMVNAYEMLALLGYPTNHPYRLSAKVALQKLLIVGDRDAYCQPCVSPVWDTALICLALHETNGGKAMPQTLRALDWLQQGQVLDVQGDWSRQRPRLRPGGWPFQFANAHYPDLDDTAAVAWAMHQAGKERYQDAIARAAEWLAGMQSRNGGFGSFDVDNTYYYLNEIPFADHGALLDPPTADVSARCVTLFGQLKSPTYAQTLRRCLRYLQSEQEANGSWFGRWGTNYIYGTWSVLMGLEQAGVHKTEPYVRRAVAWLKWAQRADGGWGETNNSYLDAGQAGQATQSTAFQTAWAMLALLAAGEGDCAEVRRGAEYLLHTQQHDGLWQDPMYTAPGFPRVFYLKYHGYDKYFPMWALARYYNLKKSKIA
jgi:squalene-hopene/tetraprenyl-beta-curcumene cyclase